LWTALVWHLRGVYATEANRRVAFSVRGLWQPAEVEARRGLARDVAADLPLELRIDRDSGYRFLSSSDMPDVGEVCDHGRDVLAKARPGDGEHPGDKKFFEFRLATDEQRLALLRVALDRRMIAMAAAYLGVLPVITEADYYCSQFVPGPFLKSQLWHCDDDAGDVLKIFIYCDDVGDEDGPFELVDSAMSHDARLAVGYRYGGHRNRVADDQMDDHVARPQQLSIRGPRGTAFVVDTVRCFHRGSRIVDPDHRRIAAMVCYCPPAALSLPRRLAKGRAPLARFANHFAEPLQLAVLGAPVARKWI
jgi:hypothetical protein